MTIVLIIFSLLFGVSLGFWVFSKHQRSKRYIDSATTYTIYLLIFSMGIAVGTNKSLIINMFTIGWQAILISFCAMLGSVLVAILFFRFLIKKKSL